MSTRRHRWVCPRCGQARLASARPRKTATVRYCLPCSEATGTLVERTCPVLERERRARVERKKKQRDRRAAARARAKARAKDRRAERDEAKWHYGGRDLRDEARRLLQVARSNGYTCRRPKITVNWRHKGNHGSGRSWGGRVHLTIPRGSLAAPALALLAHELAHEIAPASERHGPEWRWIFRCLVEQGYGCTMQYESGCDQYAYHRAAIRGIAAALGEGSCVCVHCEQPYPGSYCPGCQKAGKEQSP